MKKLVYQGIFDEVIVPDLSSGAVVKRGMPIDVPDGIAERLLEQPENWAISGAKRQSPSIATPDTTA